MRHLFCVLALLCFVETTSAVAWAPFDLVVRLLRPDGTVAMERTLAAQ